MNNIRTESDKTSVLKEKTAEEFSLNIRKTLCRSCRYRIEYPLCKNTSGPYCLAGFIRTKGYNVYKD